MKNADDIKELFEKSNVDINSTRDLEIQQKVLDSYEKHKPAQPVQIWRIIMRSQITKFAAAAVIIGAGVVCFQFLSGTSAYAQVVQEIKNARTIVYTLIRQANTGTGETIKVDVAYKEPGHLRTTTVDGYIAILDQTSGKMISIIPQGGYSTSDLKDLKSNDGGPFADIEAMKALPAKAELRLASKDIDGIECDGYQVTQGDMITTVWLDAKTGDVVQIELKYANAPGMNTIMKNIKLDIPLEDSLFSLTPPAGFNKLGDIKVDSAIPTEEVFVNWLRWWANGNVDETFPPMVAGSEIAKVVMDMANKGKFKNEAWNQLTPTQMFNALLFVANLPKDSNWRYAGNGVKFGTADKPIFWYLPGGSSKYRVIYGDLSIKEVAPEDLPK